MIRLTVELSIALSRNTATASDTISARNGRISALGWVRVSKTTVSPSLSRFFEMATSSWCQNGTARWLRKARQRLGDRGVHDVSGRHGGDATDRADQQPAALVDAGSLAGERLARREA